MYVINMILFGVVVINNINIIGEMNPKIGGLKIKLVEHNVLMLETIF